MIEAAAEAAGVEVPGAPARRRRRSRTPKAPKVELTEHQTYLKCLCQSAQETARRFDADKQKHTADKNLAAKLAKLEAETIKAYETRDQKYNELDQRAIEVRTNVERAEKALARAMNEAPIAIDLMVE